jgi:hypothetical protein
LLKKEERTEKKKKEKLSPNVFPNFEQDQGDSARARKADNRDTDRMKW